MPRIFSRFKRSQKPGGPSDLTSEITTRASNLQESARDTTLAPPTDTLPMTTDGDSQSHNSDEITYPDNGSIYNRPYSTLPSWSLAKLQRDYEPIDTFNRNRLGPHYLPIVDDMEGRYNTYRLFTEIRRTNLGRASKVASLSGEVLAAMLANFTFSDANGTHTEIWVDEEDDSALKERELHPEDFWSFDNREERVLMRMQRSFAGLHRGNVRWPGRVKEVECYEDKCEIPMEDSSITFWFEPFMTGEEVMKFRAAQKSDNPPEHESEILAHFLSPIPPSITLSSHPLSENDHTESDIQSEELSSDIHEPSPLPTEVIWDIPDQTIDEEGASYDPSERQWGYNQFETWSLPKIRESFTNPNVRYYIRTYDMTEEIYSSNPGGTVALFGGDVLAAILADFTSRHTGRTFTQSAEDGRMWIEEFEGKKARMSVTTELQEAYEHVLKGTSRWPGRIAEVTCQSWSCAVPIGNSYILLDFTDAFSEEELDKFYAAQNSVTPPQ
ncbi:hypothetical protein TREMEDRAFT_62629 [Tremella mesenterica DSM 1558]|uniref:uncharacterized protein n=1 Tax=Tremella mesenterica (strain ATCC 24925 / CBS 8224 / DSM 1558 / NBRC 9311 / NRRL Y-6157 / RJB 2259-6 / UBC 559-6) TaxID=578456 RepID=UPI0003F49A03|nr:uncharacterized protein TREMEDRAFT_62629 [Tremella mesenterica DSM 1558]EIW68911.1 hypothetical protein TREMEDRAFT_62629 [Tremella mesenterica DSM 1558]